MERANGTPGPWIVLAGRPGAGKGTQAAAAVTQFGLTHVSTGELVRSAITSGTALGAEVAALSRSGALVPDDIMLAMLERALQAIAPSSAVLFDGFPRTLAQADALRALHPIDLAVELVVPARRVVERLGARRRVDDSDSAIAARLSIYERETRPMLRQFDAHGVLVTVDGDQLPELVTANLCHVLSQVAAGHRGSELDCATAATSRG